MNKKTPKITIVTVTYNAKNDLLLTMESVLGQSYDNIEYIIIDGGSTDGTLEVIQESGSLVSKWVSEPDQGIYDAMNKGIKMATGEFVNFMNAGDRFYACDVIESIEFPEGCENNWVLYGDHAVEYSNGRVKVIASNRPISSLWKGMVFSHQSAFISLDLLRENMFDSTLKIGADFKQVMMLCSSARFKKIGLVVSTVSAGGISDSKRIASVREREAILRQSGVYRFKQLLYYKLEILSQLARVTAKAVLAKL